MNQEDLNMQLYAESVERQEFATIKAVGAKLSKDGNQWCWLLGANLQEGIAGFGGTAYTAMLDFNRAFSSETIQLQNK